MNRHLPGRFVRICFATIASFTMFSAASPASTPPAEVAGLDRLFAPVDHRDTPGCAVGIRREGAPPILRTYGVSDLEHPIPISQSTIFEAGSVSKQFTAAAIAVLAHRGILSLDDDVRRFVPELPDYGTPITIRELLSHTSGLRNWDDLVELQGWPRGTRLATQDGVLKLLSQQRSLNFKPGTEFLYSNSNYVIAAIIVARASGESFEDFSHRELFAPLGMTRTQWREDYTTVVKGRAIAFTPDNNGVWHLDMPFEDVVGAGGLLTTTTDLLRWNRALSQPRAADEAWVDMLSQSGRLADGTPTGYALGLELDRISGISVISHAGATAGYRAYLARVPDRGLSIAVLCNAGNLNTEDMGPRITALFLPAQPAPSSRSLARPIDPSAAALAGLYRNEETGAPVKISVDDEGVRFNGGEPFFSVDATTLSNESGTRRAIVTRRGEAIASVRLNRVGNTDVELVPVTAWHPDASSLAGFIGRYESDELQVAYSANYSDGALSLIGPTGTIWKLEPRYPDVFESPDYGWIVTFSRNERGEIESLRFSSTRSRNIRFRREP